MKISFVGAGLVGSILLGVVSFPSHAQTAGNYHSFADWCVNKASLPADAKHTVEVLLKQAGTQNCQEANQKLSALTELYLKNNQISDLQPLSGLTNLTYLDLNGNQISNLQPLSGFTNLILLDLSQNQISDLQPLSSLTKLAALDLSFNQISNLQPLSSLTKLELLGLGSNQISNLQPLSGFTKLTELDLTNNPKLTNKTCPLKPESICRF